MKIKKKNVVIQNRNNNIMKTRLKISHKHAERKLKSTVIKVNDKEKK